MRFLFRTLLLLIVWGLAAGQQVAAQSRAVPESPDQITLSFAPVVKRVAPAVVNIFTRKIVNQQQVSPFFDDPFFKRFFGDDSPLFGAPRQRIERSLGSGVIISRDGIIVTNHHVIGDADEITVVLNDRREYEAELIGSDERTDLAVLRIDAGGTVLPFLELRDSDELEVGDIVIAVGNPFGVGQSVTSGIVSALARTNVGVSDFQSFIQTDAAINPGNSGGALVTTDGRLVGVNTAIYSRSGGSIGIGFAIPSDMVKVVVGAILNGGEVRRPWLGVAGQPVTSEIAGSLGLDRPVGVLINRLHPRGPAAAADIAVGDIIDAVNGYEIPDADALNYRIATSDLDATVTLGGWFDGRRGERQVRLTSAPEDPPRDLTTLDGNHPMSGATVANLSPALAEEIGFDDMAEGVIVMGVVGRSRAARLGLRAGDIILTLNDRDVSSVRRLEDFLSGGSRRWAITVRRGNKNLSVTVDG